ncbi:MAG: efflux RND transporter periplasmic adaptor subunit [Alphaproteobacteria bacterium]|nr:efflux RND transporter periplasmic adaptor subunit [Alphaproteobacteria bacterium]
MKHLSDNGHKLTRYLAILAVAGLMVGTSGPSQAQSGRPLSPIAQNLDANGNGVIERGEARGPADANFDTIDKDKSGTLDGDELFNFFQGGGSAPDAASTPPSSGDAKPGEKRPLSPQAKARDANNNGVLERSETGGPIVANFDAIDKDKSGTLDGDELFEFFQGGSNSSGSGGSGPPANVVVDAVIDEPLSQTVPVLGRIVASEFGPIAARISGPVNEMHVNVGDRVESGAILAVLDRERLSLESDRYEALVKQQSAKLATVLANLEKRSLELKRLEGIRKSAAFSQARFQDAVQDVAAMRGEVAETRAQLAQAEAQLKSANIDVQDGEIRAPYPGVVSAKHTEVGAYLNIGSPVVTLINDLDIEIEADVPGNRLGGLTPGTSIRVTLDDRSEHKAVVRAVIPDENPRTRTRPARFVPNFVDLKKPLATNQSVTVHVPVGEARTVTTVSKDAIVRRGGNVLVFVVRDGNGQPQPVKLGESVGGRFIVTSGVKAGDRVVVRGNENLRPGQRLRISGDPTTPANGVRGGG